MRRVVEGVEAVNSQRKVLIFGLLAFAASGIFAAYWFSVCNSKVFACFALLGCLAVTALVCVYKSEVIKNKSRGLVHFSIILSVFCLVYAFAFPPFSVADEGHHYFASYWLSDIVMGQATPADGNAFPIRSEDVDFYDASSTVIDYKAYRTVAEHFFEFSDNPNELEMMTGVNLSIGGENIFAKLGSVVGLLFGRLFGLGAYPLFYLGRITSALFFIGCAVLAVKITPVGKSVFAVVSLLPMTLHLAASYSYDGGIIGIAFVLTALLLKAIYCKEKLSKFELFGILLCSIMLAPMKVIYTLLLGLVFFIPADRFASRRSSQLFKAGVLAAALLSILCLRLASVSALAASSGTGLDSRGTEVGHFYDLSDFIAKPIAAITLFLRTFDSTGDFYLRSTLGGSLGWFQANIAIPFFYLVPILVVLFLSVQRDDEDTVQPTMAFRISAIAIALVCFLALHLSMALAWTFDNETVIQGVQGRYFLPFLPAALLALRSRAVKVAGNQFTCFVTSISVINILMLIRMVAVAIV